MNEKEINSKNHMLLYILLPLIIIIGGVSYYRFVIKHDYIVEYDGMCDPAKDRCFMDCEDDSCASEHYYTKVQKYAPDLFAECGKDISKCEISNVCLPTDRSCSVTFCDPKIDGDKCSFFDSNESVQNTNVSNSNQNNL